MNIVEAIEKANHMKEDILIGKICNTNVLININKEPFEVICEETYQKIGSWNPTLKEMKSNEWDVYRYCK